MRIEKSLPRLSQCEHSISQINSSSSKSIGSEMKALHICTRHVKEIKDFNQMLTSPRELIRLAHFLNYWWKKRNALKWEFFTLSYIISPQIENGNTKGIFHLFVLENCSIKTSLFTCARAFVHIKVFLCKIFIHF